MSGVIDDDGTQWEHCNGCGGWVKIEELLYGHIRPELIPIRQAEIDAWVAEDPGRRKSGPPLDPDEMLDLCNACARQDGALDVNVGVTVRFQK